MSPNSFLHSLRTEGGGTGWEAKAGDPGKREARAQPRRGAQETGSAPAPAKRSLPAWGGPWPRPRPRTERRGEARPQRPLLAPGARRAGAGGPWGAFPPVGRACSRSECRRARTLQPHNRLAERGPRSGEHGCGDRGRSPLGTGAGGRASDPQPESGGPHTLCLPDF